MNLLEMDFQHLGRGASMLALFLVLFVVAKGLKRWLTPYDIDRELTGNDNVAQACGLAGYYAGFTVLFCGAYLGPSQGWLMDLAVVAGYTGLGLVLLTVSRYLNDRFILHEFSIAAAIRDDHNKAAGVVQGANYLASAFVVAGAIHGEGGGVITALVFYAIGQVALLLFSRLYEWLTPYRIQDEIAGANLAAGLGFGGSMVAISLVIMAATNDDFVSWTANLSWLGINILGVFIYLIGARLFFDKVLISRDDLNREIAQDRNTGAGLLEFAIAISFAAVLYFMIG
ncbi:DUF350 domain-containing protein [Marinobacter sp. R17]|uniref:DUF350 domain-containing protein n=1 Tax=Marinobacter sp. R17 TaxID=2484250 RepID=UPI001CC21775|nr:DUF350 domain-containing protein [Marinobacter sp. R17]